MPGRSVWLRILGVVDSVLESLVEEPDGSVVAQVRPKRRQRQRCGVCGQRCPLYDQGAGRRWWRGLDLGSTCFYVEAAAPRVSCRGNSFGGNCARRAKAWYALLFGGKVELVSRLSLMTIARYHVGRKTVVRPARAGARLAQVQPCARSGGCR